MINNATDGLKRSFGNLLKKISRLLDRLIVCMRLNEFRQILFFHFEIFPWKKDIGNDSMLPKSMNVKTSARITFSIGDYKLGFRFSFKSEYFIFHVR